MLCVIKMHFDELASYLPQYIISVCRIVKPFQVSVLSGTEAATENRRDYYS